MNFLWKLLGAVVGGVTGCIVAAWVVASLSGNNSMVAGFVAILLLPTGFICGIVGGIKSTRYVQYRLKEVLHGAKTSVKLLYVASVLAGIIGLNIVCVHWLIRAIEPPPDHQLLAHFAKNKPAMDQLVVMVHQDKGLTRVDEGWYDTKPGKYVSQARVDLYRKRLRSVNIPRGLQMGDSYRQVKFFYWVSGGGVGSTSIKGYLYSETIPFPQFTTLDVRSARFMYRHIEGHWYLLYEFHSG